MSIHTFSPHLPHLPPHLSVIARCSSSSCHQVMMPTARCQLLAVIQWMPTATMHPTMLPTLAGSNTIGSCVSHAVHSPLCMPHAPISPPTCAHLSSHYRLPRSRGLQGLQGPLTRASPWLRWLLTPLDSSNALGTPPLRHRLTSLQGSSSNAPRPPPPAPLKLPPPCPLGHPLPPALLAIPPLPLAPQVPQASRSGPWSPQPIPLSPSPPWPPRLDALQLAAGLLLPSAARALLALAYLQVALSRLFTLRVQACKSCRSAPQ